MQSSHSRMSQGRNWLILRAGAQIKIVSPALPAPNRRFSLGAPGAQVPPKAAKIHATHSSLQEHLETNSAWKAAYILEEVCHFRSRLATPDVRAEVFVYS